MFCKSTIAWLMATSACLACASVADGETVIVEGTAEIQRLPDSMRLQIDLIGMGRTLAEALDGLEKRRVAAIADVTKCGAAPESIRISGPTLAESKPYFKDPGVKLVPTLAATPTIPGSPPAPLDDDFGDSLSPSQSTHADTRVSMTLTAYSPLHADSATAVLVRSHEIQEQVRVADLAGLKELEERREALSSESDSKEVPCLCGLGQASFTFVSTLANPDLQELVQHAMDDARSSAELLANATGGTLRKLARVTTQSVIAEAKDAFVHTNQGLLFPSVQPAGLSDFQAARQSTSAIAGSLTHRLRLVATFTVQHNDAP